jgi:hypothetical protein
MAHAYTPRRASLTRWLKGAPDEVIDIFYIPGSHTPYEIFFGRALRVTGESFANMHLSFLCADSYGAYAWEEMEAQKVADYRYSMGHRRVRWDTLPADLQASVKRQIESGLVEIAETTKARS